MRNTGGKAEDAGYYKWEDEEDCTNDKAERKHEAAAVDDDEEAGRRHVARDSKPDG